MMCSKYYKDDKMKGHDMNRACGTHGKEEKFVKKKLVGKY
jgi:hypothetical protein